MNKLTWPLAMAFLAAVAVTGLVLVTRPPPRPAAVPADGNATAVQQTTPASPSPAVTRTAAAAKPAPTVTAAAVPTPTATDPWGVVTAYYRDVKSHNYRAAWALISSGAVTGQTYQQFVAGYACTGAERVVKLRESGGRVSFDLAAVDDCTGRIRYYTGTYTVRHGKIVAADVTQTG